MKRRLRRGVRIAAALVAVLCLLSAALVAPWRWLDPPTSAYMLRSDRPMQQRWVPWSRLSPELAVAVLASEDQRFPDHFGFDFGAIRDALLEQRARPRGASTISQQVARNLFLWPDRSLVRKGLEAWLTLWVELLWPKQRILEIYLNVAEFGPGIWGAEAASHHAFGRPAARLDRDQACRLAAILPSPKRMSARDPSDYVRERAAEIRAEVERLGGPRYLSRL